MSADRIPPRRKLTAGELELWTYVTHGVKRLKRPPRKPAPAVAEPGIKPLPAAAKPAKIKPMPIAVPALPAKPKAKPLAPLEPKARRRLSRGQSDVDARIDLHGMRQHEAHGELHRFVAHAHGAGYRLVLVITGKGKTLPGGFEALGREAGVLRRMVPQWLAEPAMRNIILGYEPASARHGGEGALYVRLRRA